MALELINPKDLPAPATYTHIVVATGSKLVFIAGQVFGNLGRALAAAGARPEQVAKITIFVVGYRRECLPAIEEGRVALFGDHRPVDTLVGVETLSHRDFLVEVEAIAVVDSD